MQLVEVNYHEKIIHSRIILYGANGAGKHTFLRYLHKSVNPAEIAEQHQPTSFKWLPAADHLFGFQHSFEIRIVSPSELVLEFEAVTPFDAMLFIANSAVAHANDNSEAFRPLVSALRGEKTELTQSFAEFETPIKMHSLSDKAKFKTKKYRGF